MNKTKNILIFLVICSCFSGILNKLKTTQHFQATCSNWQLAGAVLTGSCRKMDGNWNNNAHVDLNGCVTNENGNLRTGGNRFYETCWNCSLNNTILHCTCRTRNGGEHNSTLDLSGFVTNRDGNLTC